MADDRLTVDDGETYDVADGQRQEYLGATVDGQLDLTDGSMSLIDDPEDAIYSREIDQPGGTAPITIPLDINITDMQLGNAVFLTLTLGLLGGLVGFLRNYAAGIVLGLSILILIVSGLLGIGLELFWAAVSGTVLLLIAGMALRWFQ